MKRWSVLVRWAWGVALVVLAGTPQATSALQDTSGSQQIAVADPPLLGTDSIVPPATNDLSSLANTRALGMGFLSDLLVYNQMGDQGAMAFLGSRPPILTANVFSGQGRATAPLAPHNVPEAERVGTGLNGTAALLASFSPRGIEGMARGRGSANRPPELGWAPRWWLMKYDAEWIR